MGEILGAHERDRDEDESALRAYQKAISCSPHNPRDWSAAADQLFALGRFEQAAVALGQLETARMHYAHLRRIDPHLADKLARALPELQEATH